MNGGSADSLGEFHQRRVFPVSSNSSLFVEREAEVNQRLTL